MRVEQSILGGDIMIYITGDTHRSFGRIELFCRQMKTTKKDILIMLGDVGINYDADEEDKQLKKKLHRLPLTLFCIHGNHEQRPQCIPGYTEKVWHGGTIFIEPEYPNLLFAKDGEIFDFDGRKCIVIGGAYSIDKFFRLERGGHWWENEQPSDEIKERVENALKDANWQVDTVFSHTCPLKYEPTEGFLPGIDQSTVDKSTEEWLDSIESRLHYKQWYCGHYHITKKIDKMVFMFKDFRVFSFGEDQS
jgi:predicted phosphodiesterase